MDMLGICNSFSCNNTKTEVPWIKFRSIGVIVLRIPIEQRRRPLDCPNCKHALMWIKENQKARSGTKFGRRTEKHVPNKHFDIYD